MGTWLCGRVGQALELATQTLHPRQPLRPSLTRLEEPTSLRCSEARRPPPRGSPRQPARAQPGSAPAAALPQVPARHNRSLGWLPTPPPTDSPKAQARDSRADRLDELGRSAEKERAPSDRCRPRRARRGGGEEARRRGRLSLFVRSHITKAH